MALNRIRSWSRSFRNWLSHGRPRQTYTFKIDPRAEWQNLPPLNGRQFVAADAKFAFERYATEGVHKSYWVNLSSIEAIDANYHQDIAQEAHAGIRGAACGAVPDDLPRELVDSGDIDKKVVGTDPMILKEALAADHVTLTKDPGCWDQLFRIPQYAEFRFEIY